MRYPHEVYGFPAAEGIFHGPIFWIDEQPGSQSLKGARAEELSAFETAVKTAIKELQSLSFRSPEPAGDRQKKFRIF
jgi:hypothetical protein